MTSVGAGRLRASALLLVISNSNFSTQAATAGALYMAQIGSQTTRRPCRRRHWEATLTSRNSTQQIEALGRKVHRLTAEVHARLARQAGKLDNRAGDEEVDDDREQILHNCGQRAGPEGRILTEHEQDER